jgi:ribosomal protein S18 acetylase RimI-like enzyme
MRDISVSLLPLSRFSGNELESHLEYLRKTRNSSKQFMTRSQEDITPEMQKKWYNNLANNFIPYIFIASEHGVVFYPVGYGTISIENDAALLTGVIDESMRGKGLGRKLFSSLINESKEKCGTVSLEVLISNQSAQNLYKSLGFIETSRTDKIINMELTK